MSIRVSRLSLIRTMLSALVTVFLAFGFHGVGYSSQTTPKAWTVMVYMASDNNLERGAFVDINELETTGSSDQVNFLVQIDRSGLHFRDPLHDWTGGRRYFIQRDDDPFKVTSPVKDELGDVDMAEKDSVIDFVRWAKENFPAKKYAFIFWNHGTGWKEIRPSMIGSGGHSNTEVPLIDFGGHSNTEVPPGTQNIMDLISFNISYDDTSGSSMDLPSLRETLSQAREILGQPLELLGFDACLMQMAEVAHSAVPFARYQVGSPYNEPENGWPYDLIAPKLVKNPSWSGLDLGKAIVSYYAESYDGGSQGNAPVVLSLLDLQKSRVFFEGLNSFARVVRKNIMEIDTIDRARAQALKYVHQDYVDLGHFLQILSETTSNAALRAAADELFLILTGSNGKGGFVVKTEFTGMVTPTFAGKFANSKGLSIFFPDRNRFFTHKLRYRLLSMSNHTEWYSMLEELESPSIPYLKIEDVVLEDENMDGRIAPGEKVKVSLVIRNLGKVDATDAQVVCETQNKFIVEESLSATLKQLPGPGRSKIVDAFVFQVTDDAPINSGITLDFSVSGKLIPISTIRTTFFVKEPFSSESHVLLIYTDGFSPGAPILQSMFRETNIPYDIWDRLLDGDIQAEVLKRYLNGWILLSVQDSSQRQSLSLEEIDAVASFLKLGGRLVITGQDFAFALRNHPFLTNMCRAVFVQDDINIHVLRGSNGFGRNGTFPIYGSNGANNQKWPDEIDPLTDAEVIMTYNEAARDIADISSMAGPDLKPGSLSRGRKSTGAAAIRVVDGYRLMLFAFGLEGISSASQRNQLLKEIKDFMHPPISRQILDLAEASDRRARVRARTQQDYLNRVDLLSSIEARIAAHVQQAAQDSPEELDAAMAAIESLSPVQRKNLRELEKNLRALLEFRRHHGRVFPSR